MINPIKIPSIAFVFALFLSLQTCNSKPSLQTYFVEHQEAPNFMSIDFPVSFLGVEQIHLNKNQQDAIDSIDKLNILGYRLQSGSAEEYSKEVETVKNLLKSETYQELLRVGNSKAGRIQISYIGEDKAIDEVVIFGSSKEYGFAVIRVLGHKMEVSKIMELGSVIDKLDTKNANMDGFLDFMLK